MQLWFGDERGYNATWNKLLAVGRGCGLVMKEDITQPLPGETEEAGGCGLVMKEDITQRIINLQKRG